MLNFKLHCQEAVYSKKVVWVEKSYKRWLKELGMFHWERKPVGRNYWNADFGSIAERIYNRYVQKKKKNEVSYFMKF